jgi:hypothetical protein
MTMTGTTPVGVLLILSQIVSIVLAGYSTALRSEYFKELTCPHEPVPLFEGKVNYIWVRN